MSSAQPISAEAADIKTMTLNLRSNEMARLEHYAAQAGMSKTAVMRSALRLYDLVQQRLEAGERMSFSGDHARHVEFVGPDFPLSTPPEPPTGGRMDE